ncbi:hypothetical protein BC941DRAFT_464533 [Chlamydoabsidia padenii]|nr:hypothetical protein BC941DRAFT_464533 [Chlamydoabsidia padenii]
MAKPVATSLIKPYLKKLTLQVHPDFFHGDGIKKQHNANMLQQLYTVLDPILRPNTSTPLTEPVRLSFYNKRALQQQRRRKTSCASILPGVVFSTPKQAWPTIQTFFSLCQQLDISILPSDQDAVQAMITPPKKKHQGHRSLQQEFAEALYKEQQQQQTQGVWTRAMVLEQPFFMCDDKVDRQAAADKLVQWLPSLHPERWWGRLPTLFLSLPMDGGDLAKGILILDDTMTLEEMDKYIRHHLDIKLKEYQGQSPTSTI